MPEPIDMPLVRHLIDEALTGSRNGVEAGCALLTASYGALRDESDDHFAIETIRVAVAAIEQRFLATGTTQ